MKQTEQSLETAALRLLENKRMLLPPNVIDENKADFYLAKTDNTVWIYDDGGKELHFIKINGFNLSS